MNHTPGPWGYKKVCRSEEYLCDGEHFNIGGGLAVGVRRKANARLIAAAPELLKALIDILPLADFGASEQSPPYADDHLLLAAQAAIAKATGGSHE